MSVNTGWQSITEILYRAITERIKTAGIIPQVPKSSPIWYIYVETQGRIIFQIRADPEELFTTAQKSEIFLHYGKMLQHPGCRTSLFLPSSNHWDPGHHAACKGGALASSGEWAKHFFINSNFTSNMVFGQTVVVFNHLTNHLNIFFGLCFSFLTRSFPFFCASCVFVPLNEPRECPDWWDPAIWTVWIIIPEPSPHGSCAAKLTILEDYLWFLKHKWIISRKPLVTNKWCLPHKLFPI